MLFMPSFDSYWENVWEHCTDTGVGEIKDNQPSDKYLKFFKEVCDNDYKGFAKWLYDKRYDIDKEIEFFNYKYLDNTNSREATYQVLSYEFDKWVIMLWNKKEIDL